MYILFFTKGDKSVGSSRQRVWRLAEHLHASFGYEYEVLYPRHKDFSDRKKIQRAMARSDILFVHKSLFSWGIVMKILASKYIYRKKLVYDLDDAEWKHSWAKTFLLTFSADVVLCGSHPILTWCLRYNKHSVLVPTVIDHDVYAAHQVTHDAAIATIGWVGTGKGHFQDGHFHDLKQTLDRLFETHTFRFVVVGAMQYQPLKDFFKSALYDVEYIDELAWSHADAVAETIEKYHFTIGVMPVSDTPFNRAKCAFKAIEYMGCGVPVVASRVGEAIVVVENNAAGFCAMSHEEWLNAFQKLFDSKALRETMGRAGMEVVKNTYSYAVIVPRVDALLRSLS